MRRCLVSDPEARPDAKELVELVKKHLKILKSKGASPGPAAVGKPRNSGESEESESGSESEEGGDDSGFAAIASRGSPPKKKGGDKADSNAGFGDFGQASASSSHPTTGGETGWAAFAGEANGSSDGWDAFGSGAEGGGSPVRGGESRVRSSSLEVPLSSFTQCFDHLLHASVIGGLLILCLPLFL